jgi:hypothetical protein
MELTGNYYQIDWQIIKQTISKIPHGGVLRIRYDDNAKWFDFHVLHDYLFVFAEDGTFEGKISLQKCEDLILELQGK